MSTPRKKPLYSKMNGVCYPKMFSPKCFKEALEYKAQPEDVFLCTYPKSGSHWMLTTVMYIFRKGKELEEMSDFRKFGPFIDMLGNEGITHMSRPGIIKTQLPFPHIPYSAEAKYIFLARNPKDCCVSLYHHTKELPGFGFWDGNFDDLFELIMAGEVEYNDYFDHLLSWYPRRNDSNVFFTTYEDMKKDTRNTVLKLAKFLGKEYIDAIEGDPAVLENILLYSGFEYMKKNMSHFFTQSTRKRGLDDIYSGLKYMDNFSISLNPPKGLKERELIRNGTVGDWKNYFSKEQNNRMNKKMQEKFSGTEILHWFSME